MPYSPQVSNRKPSKQSNNQPTWGACSTIQITNKTVSQNSRCYQHTGILRTSSTCPNMQPKSGFVSKAAKQGKLTIPLYKTPEQSPSLKQKRVPMSSLCTPCCMQYKLKKHLLTGMQMFWKRTGLRGSAGTLRQVIFTNKSCTRQTTNWQRKS